MATVDWSPFYGETLPQKGFITVIGKEAFKRAGHEMSIEFMPWKRAMVMAKEGKYDGVFGCWINKDIEPDYIFSKEHMGSGDGHFLAPKNSTVKIDKLEDLKRKTSRIC